MFSLIITIVSIALVAALALATIYYGGVAFNKSAASADATKILTQSQQVLAADRLYRVDHEGQMPPSMQALIDGNYLKSIPSAKLEATSFEALAATIEWQMIVAPNGRAYSLTSAQLSEDACKEINGVSFGQRGVLKDIMTGFKTQCYGPSSTELTALVVADPITFTTASFPKNPLIVEGASVTTSNWRIAPSTGSSSSSGSSGGSSSGAGTGGSSGSGAGSGSSGSGSTGTGSSGGSGSSGSGSTGGSTGTGGTGGSGTSASGFYQICQATGELLTIEACTVKFEQRCTVNTPPTWTAQDVQVCVYGSQISSIDDYPAYGVGCKVVNRNNGAGDPACPASHWPQLNQ